MAETRSASRGGEVVAGAGNVSVDRFTEAVFSGVLRAIDARQGMPPGKIIYGIIYDPTLGALNVAGPAAERR